MTLTQKSHAERREAGIPSLGMLGVCRGPGFAARCAEQQAPRVRSRTLYRVHTQHPGCAIRRSVIPSLGGGVNKRMASSE